MAEVTENMAMTKCEMDKNYTSSCKIPLTAGNP